MSAASHQRAASLNLRSGMAMRSNAPYAPVVDITVIRRLSTISTARWLTAAFGNWIVIGGAIAAFQLWPHWAVGLCAIILIGARQHALGVLMHEGVHWRVASNRVWNDLLSDWLAGYAILTPTEGYRAFHLKHHRLLDTSRDPERITVDRFEKEWTYPMPRRRFWGLLLRDLSGLWPIPEIVLLKLIWNIPGRRIRHAIPIAALMTAIAALSIATGHFQDYVLFWWLPLFTVFPLCFRLRTAAEHSGIAAGQRRFTRGEVDVVGTTRTTVSNPVGRFFLAPHGINYHIEHHLYPSVPYFRLPQLHALLQADPEFASRSRSAAGYGQAISELTEPRCRSASKNDPG